VHPRPPAPHSPLLVTTIPDTVTLTGGNSALAVLKDGLIGFEGVQIETLEGAIRVSGVKPAALAFLLTLAEQGGLSTDLEGRERLVQGVADRLCAWESDLAVEAKAIKVRCASCGSKLLMPVTQSSDQPSRTVSWWCMP
jgi:hypothetical protein